jgi:TPR repeat protein
LNSHLHQFLFGDFGSTENTLQTAEAMYNLGLLYHNGQGVDRDYAKARQVPEGR